MPSKYPKGKVENMKKATRLVAVVLTVAFVLSFSVAPFAAEAAAPRGGRAFRGGEGAPRFGMELNGRATAPRFGMEAGGGIGLWGAGFNFFWDADGNFLSRDVVIANLDNAVANGSITSAERDLLLERYEFCATSGGGAVGFRRGPGPGIRAFCPWLN